MSNIQFYWDGNVGAVEYDVRRTLFTTKPSVPDVSFDTIVYSEDDKVAKKILNDTLSDLTDAEIATIKLFANASAQGVPSGSISNLLEEHNNDATTHPDIRVLLSNLHEFAHKVASVWSTEVLFEEFTSGSTLSWPYVINDINDCTKSDDATVWVSPVSESYDVTVRLGFEGLDATVENTFTVEILNDGKVVKTGTYSFPVGTIGFPSLELQAEDVVVQEGHKVSVRLTTSAKSGVIVPSRSFLTVDNAGFVLAQRTAEYMYNTLANLMFTNGNSAELANEGIVTGKWTPEVVQFNS